MIWLSRTYRGPLSLGGWENLGEVEDPVGIYIPTDVSCFYRRGLRRSSREANSVVPSLLVELNLRHEKP